MNTPEQKIVKVSFPHMGNYFAAFKLLAEILGDEVVLPPPITKRTIELGFKYSPESVCIPFKYNLGNYIEALDKGANLLIQAGGGCRFGYYGEVQGEILKKLGYKFDLFRLTHDLTFVSFFKDVKKFKPTLSYYKIFKILVLAYARVWCIDAVEGYMRLNVGFAKKSGEFERLLQMFLGELQRAYTLRAVRQVKKKYLAQMKQVEVDKPVKPLRVGVIGELYVLMEPFSNFNIEKELAKKGIEVHRFVTVSSILHDTVSFWTYIFRHLHHARPYLKYHIGAHGTESVAKAHQLIKQGFDGLIHVKPFGCMPEVNSMSALHKMSKDYKFPIIYFSFDALTSETGIKTRLEAFYDMLIMKKRLYAK